jgi:anti-sigma factor RsiW
MACADYEDRLLDYAGLTAEARARVDAHVAQCTACREFRDALGVVDAGLTAAFAGRDVSARFAPALGQRLRQESSLKRPSWVPELLDSLGWSSIVALVALLAWWLSPLASLSAIHPAISLNVRFAAASLFLLAAFVVGIRSFAQLKH